MMRVIKKFHLKIVPGTIGQKIFHKPGPDKLWWSAEIDLKQIVPLLYQGEIMGPVGSIKINFERAFMEPPDGVFGYTFLDFKDGEGFVMDPETTKKSEKRYQPVNIRFCMKMQAISAQCCSI